MNLLDKWIEVLASSFGSTGAGGLSVVISFSFLARSSAQRVDVHDVKQPDFPGVNRSGNSEARSKTWRSRLLLCSKAQVPLSTHGLICSKNQPSERNRRSLVERLLAEPIRVLSLHL